MAALEARGGAIRKLKRPGARAGITLIELLIVVAIIGVIATIAMIGVFSARTSAANSKAKADLRTLSAAQFSYYSKNDRFGTWNELVVGGFMDASWTGGKLTGEDGIVYTETQEGTESEFEGEAAIMNGNTYIIDESGYIQQTG